LPGVFDSGKIELTNAELIEGVFMNPDNYLEKFKEKSGNAFFQKLETRKIMLGNQWDDIEKELHDPFVWDFIPHLTSSDHDDEYPATRIDAIINMYIYFYQPERTAFNFDDDKYSFKKVAEYVDQLLAPINADTEDAKNEKRFNAMFSLWSEIRKVHTTFMEWYNSDTSLVNMNSIYHRISLLRRIMLNTSQTHQERYKTELRGMKEIYNILQNTPKCMRITEINKTICKKLFGVSDHGKDFIRRLSYDSNPNVVESTLLGFNLATLENARGYGGRFPFFTFKNEAWQKEHIFASKTELADKELLKEIISDPEIRAYKDYQKILKMGNTGGDNLDFSEYDKMILEIRNILDNQLDEERDRKIAELLAPDGPIIKYLSDPYMGNMALLTKTINIKVGNKPFDVKSK
jgi:hypothetical protein